MPRSTVLREEPQLPKGCPLVRLRMRLRQNHRQNPHRVKHVFLHLGKNRGQLQYLDLDRLVQITLLFVYRLKPALLGLIQPK